MSSIEENNQKNGFNQKRITNTLSRSKEFETGQVKNPDMVANNTPAMFSKTLQHDATTLLPDATETQKLKTAMESGSKVDLEQIPSGDAAK